MTTDLNTRWQQLAQDLGANFSLYPEWSAITAASHNIQNSSELVELKRADRTIAVYPINVSSGRIFGLSSRKMGLISNSVSYHNQILSRQNPRDAIDGIVDEGIRGNVDVVHLSGIPDDSELGEYLRKAATDRRYRTHSISGDSSPYLPLATTWQDLLATKAKKFRYKLRKRAEALETSDALRMELFNSAERCPELLAAMQVVEENSWKKLAGVSIFEREHESRYHDLLLPFLAAKKAMFANVLYHDDAPIAYNLCCVWDGWVGQMKTSFDTEYANLSPGSLVIDTAIQHAIDLNATEFDFLGDTDPHKLAWTKSVRAHSDHFLYLRSTLKGNIIGLLKSMRNRMVE